MLIFFDAQNLNAQVFHHPKEAFVVYLSLKFMIELKNKVHIKGQVNALGPYHNFTVGLQSFMLVFKN